MSETLGVVVVDEAIIVVVDTVATKRLASIA
jgi:hypothetical protein